MMEKQELSKFNSINMKEELKQAIELLKEIKSDLKDLKDYINKESQSFKIDLTTKEYRFK